MQSQYSHGNPAYRCRHGHTSAQTPAMRQAANLYLREDVILGRVYAKLCTLTSRDTSIQDEITNLRENRNPAELTRFLRTHGITVGCRATGVSLEPGQESLTIVACSHEAGPKQEAGVPRQRAQRQKQQRGIAKC